MISNLLLCEELSVVDDRICPPPTIRPHDLGDLLAVVAERIRPDGVLMLSGPWADYVRPVADAGGPPGDPVTHHAGEWTARVVDGDTWIRWTSRDNRAVWTCEVDAIPPGAKDSPLIDDNPVVTAANFHSWREITGVPWVGTPGMAGNALLIDGWSQMYPKVKAPHWSGCGIWYPTESKPWWPFGEIEQPYTAGQWERPHPGPVHGYDLNKAYLSAYGVVDLPVSSLVRYTPATGPMEFTGEPGIWHVQLSPWTYDDVLPDPAGYAPALEDGSRWLTTQTLTLLQELTDRGDYAGFTVLEWWGPSTRDDVRARRVTRKWAELLRDVAGAARAPLDYAAKQAYKQTYGMWARKGGRVSRPDWRAMIIAQNRVNLWRKMDRAYRAGAATLDSCGQTGQAPLYVETDCVFYPNGGWQWDTYPPEGFKLDPSGRELGHFKPYEHKAAR